MNGFLLYKCGLTMVSLVQLAGTDGQVVWVNPDQVISIRVPRGLPQHWPENTRCLVLTTDSKFFTTSEPCDAVRRKLSTPQ